MNNMKLITISAIASIVLFVGGWYVFGGIGYRNEAVRLETRFNALNDSVNKIDYDRMLKTINQVAQVPTQYSEDFKQAYTSILAAGDKTDSNAVRNMFAMATGMKPPQLDSSLYRKVQDVVESERARFAETQRQATDVKREYDTLCSTWPGSLFVHQKTLTVKLVTSTKTERAFETGKDDDTKLFRKP
jgi:hypothetical protein